MQIFLKILISSLIIAVSSEIGKRSSFMAAILISLPMTSILALSWMYMDTNDTHQVSNLCMNIFWMVLPSLGFFLILAKLLNMGLPYWGALFASVCGTAFLYAGYSFALNKLGLKL